MAVLWMGYIKLQAIELDTKLHQPFMTIIIIVRYRSSAFVLLAVKRAVYEDFVLEITH